MGNLVRVETQLPKLDISNVETLVAAGIWGSLSLLLSSQVLHVYGQVFLLEDLPF